MSFVRVSSEEWWFVREKTAEDGEAVPLCVSVNA